MIEVEHLTARKSTTSIPRFPTSLSSIESRSTSSLTSTRPIALACHQHPSYRQQPHTWHAIPIVAIYQATNQLVSIVSFLSSLSLFLSLFRDLVGLGSLCALSLFSSLFKNRISFVLTNTPSRLPYYNLNSPSATTTNTYTPATFSSERCQPLNKPRNRPSP